MRKGFLRLAAAAPRVNVADVNFNVAGIIEKLQRLDSENVELAVFPEMCVTAYTCADLFHNSTLLDAAEKALIRLKDFSTSISTHFVVGLPVRHNGTLYN